MYLKMAHLDHICCCNLIQPYSVIGSYCECFAAGIYCVGSCACETCFNKPEYEDLVLSTREQIESRNPLAFAPKIVKQTTESPANVTVYTCSTICFVP